MFVLFNVVGMLPIFIPTEHATEVDNELIKSIKNLEPQTQSTLMERLAQSLRTLAIKTAIQNREWPEAPPQRVISPLRGWG